MTLYKFTDLDGSACHGGTGRWTLGRWRSVRGPLVVCEHGLHVLRADGDKLVARRARITTRVESWNERTARLLAAGCAEHVLPVFDAANPHDRRPREAIEVARRYADGLATAEELAAAGDAAWTAARAAGDAAWAAGDAARVAERSWQSAHLLDLLGGIYLDRLRPSDAAPGAWRTATGALATTRQERPA